MFLNVHPNRCCFISEPHELVWKSVWSILHRNFVNTFKKFFKNLKNRKIKLIVIVRDEKILSGVRSKYFDYNVIFEDKVSYPNKEIPKNCKFLDQQNWQKRPQAQNRLFWSGIWKIGKPGSKFWNFWKYEKRRFTEILCRMGHTLFQTSSWGSEVKQNRFGGKFINTVQMQS